MDNGLIESISLTEAAQELGVHYMTAYRYVRQGMLNAVKVGGVWRVERAELTRFIQSHNGDGGHPEGNSGETGNGRRGAPWANRLEQRLVAGDHNGAWSVIESAINSGTSVSDVYLKMLTPALSSIGEKWHNGEIDIFVEHRATTIATRLIGQLGARCMRRGRPKGTVLLGAPASEEHAVPLLILSDLVRLAGWDVCDLGANTPAESFVAAVKDTDGLCAVGLSVFTAAARTAAAETVATLRPVIGRKVPIVIGGGAVAGREDARSLGADDWAADAPGFVELLEVLEGKGRKTG